MKRNSAIFIIAGLQLIVSSSSCVSGVFLLLLITGTVQIFPRDLIILSAALKGLVSWGFLLAYLG